MSAGEGTVVAVLPSDRLAGTALDGDGGDEWPGWFSLNCVELFGERPLGVGVSGDLVEKVELVCDRLDLSSLAF